MSHNNPDRGSGYLHEDIGRNFTPREPAPQCIGQGHSRVQMRSGDRSEGEDERNQRRAGRNGIREQSEGYVSRSQTLAHDP